MVQKTMNLMLRSKSHMFSMPVERAADLLTKQVLPCLSAAVYNLHLQALAWKAAPYPAEKAGVQTCHEKHYHIW